MKKELLEELIELKLIDLKNEINKILTKWNYETTNQFVQDARNGTIDEAEDDAITLRYLLDQQEELLNLKQKSQITSDLSIKINTSLSKIRNVLEDFKKAIKSIYGENLVDIVLYGSYARGEEREESDIDLAIVLKGDISPFQEIDRMGDIATELSLKYNVLISTHPISEKDYLTRNMPFLMNVREEGISI